MYNTEQWHMLTKSRYFSVFKLLVCIFLSMYNNIFKLIRVGIFKTVFDCATGSVLYKIMPFLQWSFFIYIHKVLSTYQRVRNTVRSLGLKFQTSKTCAQGTVTPNSRILGSIHVTYFPTLLVWINSLGSVKCNVKCNNWANIHHYLVVLRPGKLIRAAPTWLSTGVGLNRFVVYSTKCTILVHNVGCFGTA